MKTEDLTLSDSEKIGFVTNMSIMLSAGISILEIVDSLLEDVRGNQKKILETLREDLTQGKRLYSSFEKFPSVFDQVEVNIIRAAEEAGTLEVTLDDMTTYIKKEIEFKDKIKAAMAYPVLILIAFGGVLLMMLTFIIPKISQVFLRLNVVLPLPTKILIFVSNMLLTYTIPIISITAAILIFIYLLYKRQRRLLLTFIISLPLVSRLAKEMDITRFTRSLSLLLSAGIPITFALELIQNAVLKKEVSVAIGHCRDVVLSGRRLSDGLRDNKKIIPRIMIKITEAGEKSGALEKSMLDISEYMDYQVGKTLSTVTTLLEPIMLIFVGILIGGMMLSIIAPIYSLIGQVGR
ncbi:type II secretion system F family protein [Patescibacteria group bacterium]|nr:type II secretion system F family protein [Patescibacteria group bacterium]MCL5797217.1 type II secretion system F family protein [Patescibacteria group bacterium]